MTGAYASGIASHRRGIAGACEIKSHFSNTPKNIISPFLLSAICNSFLAVIPSKMTATVDFPYSVNDGKLS